MSATALREDPLLQEISQGIKATLLFDVRILSVQWGDAMNRDLDRKHVDHLKEVFLTALNRYAHDNRMVVTVTRHEWETIHALIGPENQLLMGSLDLSNAPVVPGHLEVHPILQAGQHRRAALMGLLESQKQAAEGGEAQMVEERDYLWPADVYVREDLSQEHLMALRANRQVVYKMDSFGDLFVRLCALLKEKTIKERQNLLKPRNLKTFLLSTFGYESKNSSRELQVLRHETLCSLFVRFCETRYGAQVFTVTWAANVTLGGLDFIWATKLRNFCDAAARVFRHHANLISFNDWILLLPLLPPTNTTTLRLLFFPTETDIIEKSLNSKLLQLPAAFLEANTSMPRLAATHKAGHDTRRPGFLSTLSDKEYCAVFDTIMESPNLEIPTWDYLHVSEKHTQRVTTAILHHIMIWYDANWRFPEQADVRRRSFQWHLEVNRVVLGGKQEEAARELTEAIWSMVESKPVWTEKRVMAEALEDPIKTFKDADSYIGRFTYAHWASVLRVVMDASGPVLEGPMAIFNGGENLGDREVGSFGDLAADVNWTRNRVIRGNRFLSSATLRNEFSQLVNLVALRLCYRKLKSVLERTLEQGLGSSADTVASTEEYEKALRDLKEFGAKLVAQGEDSNEFNMEEAFLSAHLMEAEETTSVPNKRRKTQGDAEK